MDKTVEESIRLDAWRSVFERANRILSELPVTVTFVNAKEVKAQGMDRVAGWSDGINISLNSVKVKEMMRTNDNLAAVLRLKGLNYHELSHVLYTPRMTDEITKRIIAKAEETGDKRWWYAYNALEDQRIETWFTATYGVSRRYFEATILEWIIREGNAEAAILVYGRKYLSPRIRVQAGNAFRAKYGKRLYEEFQTVIDDYITLVLPTDTLQAINLVGEYRRLLLRMADIATGSLPKPPVEDHGATAQGRAPGGSSVDVLRRGRIYVKDAQRARDKAQDAIDDAIDADAEMEADMKMPVVEVEGNQPQGQGSGAGSGAGDDQHVEDQVRDMMDAAHDGLNEVKTDTKVLDDANSVLDAVKAIEHNGRLEAEGKVVGFFHRDASEHDRLAVRRVTDILTRIRQEAEPETLRRQYHGRVEPRRLIARQPHEVDIFKTWDHGAEEEVGIEAVLLMDVSGSMKPRIEDAAAAMWVLKRSFDKLDIRTTVLVYDASHKVLYQPSQKAESGIPTIRASGGTNPISAMTQTIRIFSKSSAPNKVLINVTDGQWQCSEAVVIKMLRRMHSLDVTTMLLGLNGAVSKYGRHGYQASHDITTVDELPKVALKLVASIMRAKALRA